MSDTKAQRSLAIFDFDGVLVDSEPISNRQAVVVPGRRLPLAPRSVVALRRPPRSGSR